MVLLLLPYRGRLGMYCTAGIPGCICRAVVVGKTLAGTVGTVPGAVRVGGNRSVTVSQAV